MSIGAAVLYLAVLVVASFVVSGVVPRYREVVARRKRVEEFERNYGAWADAVDRIPDWDDFIGTVLPDGVAEAAEAASDIADRLRPWLVARRSQMQRDAQSVGKGIMNVAPPPGIGGPSQPHAYFADLFSAQSYTDKYPATFRRDELATVVHETGEQETRSKRDLYDPWAWVRLAFERVVRFPRYVLRHAGFSPKVADSTAARLVSVVWSLLVGAAGIGGFVLALVRAGT